MSLGAFAVFKSIPLGRLRLNAVQALPSLLLVGVIVTAAVGLYRVNGFKGVGGGETKDVVKVVNESAQDLKFIREIGWEQVESSFGLQAATGAIWIASLLLGFPLAGSTTLRRRKRIAGLRSTMTPASVRSTDVLPTDGNIYWTDGEQAAGATHAVVGGRRGRISPAKLLSRRHRNDQLDCVSTNINRDDEDMFELPAA